MTDRPRYRRTTTPARRIDTGRLPRGRRLVAIVIGLVLLAVLAGVAIAVDEDDGDGNGEPAATPTTEVVGGRAPDVVVARQLLPSAAGLGPGWAEQSRDAEPRPPEQDPGDACPQGPVPDGLVVRSELSRLDGSSLVETLSVTAGVVTEDAVVPRLDDPSVVACLRDGLAAAVPEGNTVEVADPPEVDVPDGATVTVARYVVSTAAGEQGGTFDFVLVQRDRAVSLGLLAGFQPEEATPVDAVVRTLDAAVAAGARRLN